MFNFLRNHPGCGFLMLFGPTVPFHLCVPSNMASLILPSSPDELLFIFPDSAQMSPL